MFKNFHFGLTKLTQPLEYTSHGVYKTNNFRLSSSMNVDLGTGDEFRTSPELNNDPIMLGVLNGILFANVVNSQPLIGTAGSTVKRTVFPNIDAVKSINNNIANVVSSQPYLVRELYTSFGTDWESWLKAALIAEIYCAAQWLLIVGTSSTSGRSLFFNNYAAHLNAKISGFTRELLEIACCQPFSISLPWLSASISLSTFLELTSFVAFLETEYAALVAANPALPDLTKASTNQKYNFLDPTLVLVFDTLDKYLNGFRWDEANIGTMSFIDKSLWIMNDPILNTQTNALALTSTFYNVTTQSCVPLDGFAYGFAFPFQLDPSSKIFNNLTLSYDFPSYLKTSVTPAKIPQISGVMANLFYGLNDIYAFSDVISGPVNYDNSIRMDSPFSGSLNLTPESREEIDESFDINLM